MSDPAASDAKLVLGWREWVALPELGMPAIKCKVDTGAKTSALHAFDVEALKRGGRDFVRFNMHPLQRNDALIIHCECPLLDEREGSDSGGHREMRFVISTPLVIAGRSYDIEMTLTNRERMRFRMLLGRRAMHGHMLVDPAASYLCGKPDFQNLYRI